MRVPRIRTLAPVVACGAITVLGVLVGRRAFEAMDPHATLNAQANVVYVGASCAASQAAMRLVGDGPIVPVPVYPEDVAVSSAPCEKAMGHLRAQGSALWSVVPDSILCASLVKGARAHLGNTLEGNIPAWSLYGAYLGVGVTPEIVADFEARHLLPPGADVDAALAAVGEPGESGEQAPPAAEPPPPTATP